METNAVIIKNSSTGYFMGYLKEFSMVCAQGKSTEEVIKKLDRYFKSYIKHVSHKKINFTEKEVVEI